MTGEHHADTAAGTALDAGSARRSDARRNRQRLITAAVAVFGELGAGAPLDQIARRAGIGNATMYRHFPSRDALLEAALHDVYGRLLALAERLTVHSPAIDALEQWLTAFVGYSQSYLDLPEQILVASHDETSALHASCTAMREVAAGLIRRAQTEGDLRTEVDIADVCAQANGIAWAAQHADDPDQAARMLGILLHGLRP